MAAKIYCPKCRWEPGSADRWLCSPGCGHVWNTFDTRGVCPECVKVWEMTQCLACGRTSPHENWYHDGNGDEVSEKADKAVAEPVGV